MFKQISSRSSNDDDDDLDGENLFETLKNKHTTDDVPFPSSRNATKRDDLNLFINNLASVEKSVENKEAVMRSFLDSRNLENDDFQFKDSLDFKLIDPLKDEKLIQLQAANENLRRELSFNAIEVASFASSSKPSVVNNSMKASTSGVNPFESKPAVADNRASVGLGQKQSAPVRAKNINEMMNEYNTLQRIKKNIAATKIQTLYRRRRWSKKNEDYRNQLTK